MDILRAIFSICILLIGVFMIQVCINNIANNKILLLGSGVLLVIGGAVMTIISILAYKRNK